MRTDYFDDLLPDSVTSVTRQKTALVTPEKEKVSRKTEAYASVTTVTTVTTKTGNTGQDEAIREHLEERAAIMEYDGGLSREQAETEARKALRVFQYRLTDTPDAWLVLIAPGCDLNEAQESLRARFGSRLLDTRKHSHAD